MMKCIIVDDEPLAVQLIESHIEKCDSITAVSSFTNPLEALSFLQKNQVDIIFLDVQMPEITGIQVAKIINDQTKIIFTTAYPNYAVEGFELNATDYLVKPITLERFLKAVSRISIESKVENSSSKENEVDLDYVFVKTEYKHVKIAISDILFLKSLGDYVSIHTREKRIMTLENMKSFENKLSSSKFSRVHRSYIVAIDKIDFIEKNRIVIQDESIAIGGKYQDDFWQKIK